MLQPNKQEITNSNYTSYLYTIQYNTCILASCTQRTTNTCKQVIHNTSYLYTIQYNTCKLVAHNEQCAVYNTSTISKMPFNQVDISTQQRGSSEYCLRSLDRFQRTNTQYINDQSVIKQGVTIIIISSKRHQNNNMLLDSMESL